MWASAHSCVSLGKSLPLSGPRCLYPQRDADSDELKGMKCFVTNISQMSRLLSTLLPGTRESENSAFSLLTITPEVALKSLYC